MKLSQWLHDCSTLAVRWERLLGPARPLTVGRRLVRLLRAVEILIEEHEREAGIDWYRPETLKREPETRSN